MHEVPHIIPVHTKYVNHHIFKHTYTPAFTEETIETSENITTPSCGGNMYMQRTINIVLFFYQESVISE